MSSLRDDRIDVGQSHTGRRKTGVARSGVVVVVMAMVGAGLLGSLPTVSADPTSPPVHKHQLPPPSWAEASASPDWVPTPPGLAFKGCVHEVPDRAIVSADAW